MSIIAQNSTDEVALIDHIKKFFTKYQLGKLLKKCNGTHELSKGLSYAYFMLE